MTELEYQAKCKALFAKAKEKGAELDFNAIYGDVRATLFDRFEREIAYVKDEHNAGLFKKQMEDYIQNDEELSEQLESGLLVLDNNNWIEYGGVYYKNAEDQSGITIDVGLYEDNILDDNILEAIDQVLDDLDKIKAEIIKHAKIQ